MNYMCVCVCVCVCMCTQPLSRVRLFAIPWTVALQAPLCMGFSKQEYWSGWHALFQGIFLIQGSSPGLLLLLQTGRWILYHCATWESGYPCVCVCVCVCVFVCVCIQFFSFIALKYLLSTYCVSGLC